MNKQSLAEIEKRLRRLGAQQEGDNWILWKVVSSKYKSPYQDRGKLHYPVGKRITDKKRPNYDPTRNCGAGINVHAVAAPRSSFLGCSLILLELRVKPKNIICVPNDISEWSSAYDTYYAGPKLRVRSCFVVAAYTYDAADELKLEKMARGYELIPETTTKLKKKAVK